MRRLDVFRALSVVVAAAGFICARPAAALNPLEYPDNGANQFARGGAWLATGTDPIAAHYNPAALATQASAMSIDVRLNYNHLCFDRTDENGQPVQVFRAEGDAPVAGAPGSPQGTYLEACNQRQALPLSIPAIAAVWRAADRLSFGFAIIPPAAYGIANQGFSAFADAIDENGDPAVLPAPYRFMSLGSQSTPLFPTLSFGYELFENFRIGAGFIAGMGIFNIYTGATSRALANRQYDVVQDESFSTLRVKDLFAPGIVGSIHWSATPQLDVALWGRYVDPFRASEGSLTVQLGYYDTVLSGVRPACPAGMGQASCPGAVPTIIKDDIVEQFEFPIMPPEVRAGVRFHLPRGSGSVRTDGGGKVRDPLHDDLFDVELNGSYTWNSWADAIKVRFFEQGGRSSPIGPGFLPPVVDTATGFKDSYGARLGGQLNVVRDKVGLMAGTWYESRSQRPELLHIAFPGPERGGFGGGVVLRQDFLDFTFAYQYHWSSGLQTSNGLRRGNAGSANFDPRRGDFDSRREPTDLAPELRQEFRTYHIVNNGNLTQHAHAFSVGSVMRF